MTQPAAARREEDALLASPRQAALLTAGVVALTAVVFALVAGHGTLARIQRVDDAWLRLMISGRAPALTVIAKVFNVLGLVYVTLPVRIALAGYLALRRRWWHLAAFTAAIVLSEVLIGSLKGIYDRARPPGSLVATSGASFPSGHAVAASVTVVAAVIALVPAGRRRALVGRGRGGVLHPDGALPRLPGRPLAVRRHRRDPARHILRSAGRPDCRACSSGGSSGGGSRPGRSARLVSHRRNSRKGAGTRHESEPGPPARKDPSRRQSDGHR